MEIDSNDDDHARIRKLLSYAFSETAMREQEPILNSYFDLFISKLNDQVDEAVANKVDMVSWYTYTTFDIVGSVIITCAILIGQWHLLTGLQRPISWGVLPCARKWRSAHLDKVGHG